LSPFSLCGGGVALLFFLLSITLVFPGKWSFIAEKHLFVPTSGPRVNLAPRFSLFLRRQPRCHDSYHPEFHVWRTIDVAFPPPTAFRFRRYLPFVLFFFLPRSVSKCEVKGTSLLMLLKFSGMNPQSPQLPLFLLRISFFFFLLIFGGLDKFSPFCCFHYDMLRSISP